MNASLQQALVSLPEPPEALAPVFDLSSWFLMSRSRSTGGRRGGKRPSLRRVCRVASKQHIPAAFPPKMGVFALNQTSITALPPAGGKAVTVSGRWFRRAWKWDGPLELPIYICGTLRSADSRRIARRSIKPRIARIVIWWQQQCKVVAQTSLLLQR